MLALRPTFSESWYRVAPLRARLRASAQISRQFYRGERWYVVRDPAGNQFHRLSDAAYRFVGLLDGSRTVGEAWELVGGQLDDAAPTQPEVIQILSQLFSANLLEADMSPDATVLLKRHKQLQKRQIQGRLMNLLFPRIPLWDPDAFLKCWMPVGKILFSKFGAAVWVAVIIAAIALLIPRWTDVAAATNRAINPSNWFFLYVSFALIKFIHELGHAFACRRFGGECHEMGIMFLIFIPTPYVDASSAWAFDSKWKRMFVGMAGMIVELFVAAVMAFVWASTSYENYPLLNGLAYNTMLIASVSTILFNANPLLRYDGYYILSDWLEIPNFRQKSTEYTFGLIKRHVFRIKQQQPLPPIRQRMWMLTYAITSGIYRIFIGLMIILMVTYQVPVLGVLMALGGVATWLVVPTVKLVRYLSIEPELHRKRGRAWAFTGAVTAAAIILLGVIRFPMRFEATGIVTPQRPEVLRPMVGGFVRQIKTEDGRLVAKNEPILILEDREIELRLTQMKAQLRAAEARRQASAVEDPAQRQIDQLAINALLDEITLLQEKADQLIIRAPMDGRLIAPNLRDLQDRYIKVGEPVAMVIDEQLLVRAALEQKESNLGKHLEARTAALAPDATDQSTEVRLAGNVSRVLYGVGAPRLINAAQEKLAHPSLGFAGGGPVAVDSKDPQGDKPLVEQFEVQVKLPVTGNEVWPGQRAYLRFTLDKQPLIEQWSRRFWQLIQVRSANSPWL